MTNRVTVDKPVALRSVNGPQFTIIKGHQVPGTTNGVGAIRCVFLTNGAALSGFTLTHGATQSEGDVEREPSGGGVWSASSNAVLRECVLTGNSAEQGGGACGGALSSCTLRDNSAASGGGAEGSTLYNCTLTGNAAGRIGGGASYCALYNCTLTGNSAGWHSGGAFACELGNCIVWFNRAPNDANHARCGFEYSCTSPLPAGPGNIAADPQLATASHLCPTSPCIGAGNSVYAEGRDIDGQPWASPPAMGADEPGSATGPLSLRIDAVSTNVASGYVVSFIADNTGPILQSVWDFGDGTTRTNQPFASHAWNAPGVYTVRLTGYNLSHPEGVTATALVTVSEAVFYVDAAGTNPVPPYASWETAATNIQDAIGWGSVRGRVLLVTNGVYRVGVVAVHGANRVALTNRVVVRSVNGPEVTIIEGATDGVRCAYVGSGSLLSGFTLTRGTAVGDWPEGMGGAVWCELSAVPANCVLRANSASQFGGGAFGGTLNDCTLTGNSAAADGGGAAESILNNCTLVANSAWQGGGAFSGNLNNCTLVGNSAQRGGGASEATLNNSTLTANRATGTDSWSGGGGAYSGTLNNCILYLNATTTNGANHWGGTTLNCCCTTPLPPTGFGNVTNAPLFVDPANVNFRLQSNSPCINAGNNAYASGETDLDGNPRIVSGTVDIGAYEYQGAGSTVSYAWLQRYGLPTDGLADFADPDADGRNTWQEWRCQTDPTNALSALRLLSATPAGTNVLVRWLSVKGVSYFLERSTNLAGPLPIFAPSATGIPGQPGTTSFTETNAAQPAPLFYRVGVPE